MISDASYNRILKNCDFTADRFSKECDSAIYVAAADFGDIDQYSIYTPKCVPPQDQTNQTKFEQMMQMHTTKRFLEDQYDPCTENYAEIYYNRPEVQRAMHANHTAIPYKWTACRYSHCSSTLKLLNHCYSSHVHNFILTYTTRNSWTKL